MSSEIDTEAFTSELGRVITQNLGEISRLQVRRYARAVEDDNPLFHDVEYARDAGYGDLVVPPNYLSAIIEYGEGTPVDQLREDGLDPNQFPFEVPDEAVLMGGGQDLMIDRYVVAGESVTREETFTDLYQRDSSMGTLTFLESISEFFVDEDRVLRCEVTTIMGDRQ